MSKFKYISKKLRDDGDIEPYDYTMEVAFQLKRIADLLDESNEWERMKKKGC